MARAIARDMACGMTGDLNRGGRNGAIGVAVGVGR